MTPLNMAVLAAYLLAMLGVGLAFAGRQKTTEDYFLGGRRMPWWAAGMSMYASLTSAVTFMALPGTAYRENIAFIVVSFASVAVAPVLVRVIYPAYLRMRVTTSYEYLEARFGRYVIGDPYGMLEAVRPADDEFASVENLDVGGRV